MLLALMVALQAVPAAPLLLDRKPADRPQLLILGSPHLANVNHDIANTHVEDVLAPDRQRQIKTMVASLARYKPTRIAIEWPSTDQVGLDKRYAEYRAGTLKPTPDEGDQIALRLAAKLNLPRVEAIDWNKEPPGTDADYDFDGWATAHGLQGRVKELQRRGQAEADASAARMRCTSVSDWYRALNSPAGRDRLNRIYYDYALIGDGETDPGAVWVGNWYARNLYIFGHLVRSAKPADRVLIVYGAGHGFLLDQDARQSGAFTVADPLQYLPETPPTC